MAGGIFLRLVFLTFGLLLGRAGAAAEVEAAESADFLLRPFGL